MTRSKVTRAIAQYLTDRYNGPIYIATETESDEIPPPYAVVRIGAGEQMFPGDAEIWNLNVLIGVFHDADTTSPERAEAQALELFRVLDDEDETITACSDDLAWSAWQRIATEATINETRWQHVAGYHAIVAPKD